MRKQPGLPRIFYREMQGCHMAPSPQPQDIVWALVADKELKSESAAFKALLNGDAKGWDKEAASLSEETRYEMALMAVKISEPGSKPERVAVEVFKNKVEENTWHRVTRDIKNLIKFHPALDEEGRFICS